MNTIEIGKFIKAKRVEKHFTQKDLAGKLQISFQAVSKWETGTTLPDTSLLIQLSDILEVTVDQILNAGEFRRQMNKQINIEEIVNALQSIPKLKDVLGPNNFIYKHMIYGLKDIIEPDFYTAMNTKKHFELLVAKSVYQLLVDGYYVNDEEINGYFTVSGTKEKMYQISKKYNK